MPPKAGGKVKEEDGEGRAPKGLAFDDPIGCRVRVEVSATH
jgi:hypothetical protein